MELSYNAPTFHLPMYQREGMLVMDAAHKSRKIEGAGENKELDLTEEDLMICTHEIKGFSLKLKKWRTALACVRSDAQANRTYS
jgi:hypothetical protein